MESREHMENREHTEELAETNRTRGTGARTRSGCKKHMANKEEKGYQGIQKAEGGARGKYIKETRAAATEH